MFRHTLTLDVTQQPRTLFFYWRSKPTCDRSLTNFFFLNVVSNSLIINGIRTHNVSGDMITLRLKIQPPRLEKKMSANPALKIWDASISCIKETTGDILMRLVFTFSTIKYCHSVSIESLYSTFDILRSQWSPYKFRLTSPAVTHQRQAVCLLTSKNMELMVYYENMCFTIKKDKIIFLSTINSFTHQQGVVVVVIVWQLAFQLPVQSVPIITNVVSSNPSHVRCTRYNIIM